MSAEAIAEFLDRPDDYPVARLRWLSISFALAGITIASSVRLCYQVVSGEANEWDLWLLVAKPAIRQRAPSPGPTSKSSLNRSRLPSSMPPVPCSRTSGQHSWRHWRRYSPVVSKSVMASSGGCFAISSESTSGHLMPGPRHDAAGRCLQSHRPDGPPSAIVPNVQVSVGRQQLLWRSPGLQGFPCGLGPWRCRGLWPSPSGAPPVR